MKTKKIVAGVAIALAAALMFTGAMFFTACGDDNQEGGSNTAKTTITVSGSSSVSPLMQKLADVYNILTDGEVAVTIQTSDSGTGVSDAIAGTVDFGMASRAVKDEEVAQGVVGVQIATDGVALVVGKDCSVSDVAMEEVYALYADGTAIDNVITKGISRENGSGTRDAFDSLIKNADGDELGDVESMASVISESTSTSAVKTAVSGSSDTLGYISMGSVDDTVKVLTYEGVEATVENVQNNTYKLSRPFNIVVKGDSVDDLDEDAKAFYDFIVGDVGQAIVAYEGYVPLA